MWVSSIAIGQKWEPIKNVKDNEASWVIFYLLFQFWSSTVNCFVSRGIFIFLILWIQVKNIDNLIINNFIFWIIYRSHVSVSVTKK